MPNWAFRLKACLGQGEGHKALRSRLVLDAQTRVWMAAGPGTLSAVARLSVEEAAAEHRLWVSAITPWEIGMLVAKGRLVLDRDVMAWVDAALATPGIHLAPLTPAATVASTRLPGALHGDPADRLIVACALDLGAVLVSADQALLANGRLGHVNTLAAG